MGYDKHDSSGRDLGNSRNGGRPKAVLTPGTGADRRSRGTRGGAFEPRTVKRHSRRMPGVDELVTQASGCRA